MNRGDTDFQSLSQTLQVSATSLKVSHLFSCVILVPVCVNALISICSACQDGEWKDISTFDISGS